MGVIPLLEILVLISTKTKNLYFPKLISTLSVVRSYYLYYLLMHHHELGLLSRAAYGEYLGVRLDMHKTAYHAESV